MDFEPWWMKQPISGFDGVTAVNVEAAWFAGAAAEREGCIAICREVAERYPTDVFPEDGQSLDCKSARMARLTAANIEREITERANVRGNLETPR